MCVATHRSAEVDRPGRRRSGLGRLPILEVAAEEDSNRCSEARRAAALVKVLLEAAPP